MNPQNQINLDLVRRCLLIEARCDALQAALCALAQRKCGVKPGVMEKMIAQMEDAAHQKLLELLESMDPGAAAALDTRPIKPDAPDIHL